MSPFATLPVVTRNAAGGWRFRERKEAVTEESKMQDKKMTDAQRAEVYHQLANRARGRFESFRTHCMKVTFGLWTLLAAGVAGVFMARPGTITVGLAVLGCFFAAFVVGAHWTWLSYAREVSQRDNRVSYWWETHVWRLLNEEVPNQLQPWEKLQEYKEQWYSKSLAKKKDNSKEWHSVWESDRDGEIERLAEVKKHPCSHWIDVGVTGALAVAFCVVLWLDAI